MSKLRIIDNIQILKEVGKVALEASLVCDCGSEWFQVLHTGKKTKGFLRPWLVKKTSKSPLCANVKTVAKKYSYATPRLRD